jgi:hypothetical protein
MTSRNNQSGEAAVREIRRQEIMTDPTINRSIRQLPRDAIPQPA